MRAASLAAAMINAAQSSERRQDRPAWNGRSLTNQWGVLASDATVMVENPRWAASQRVPAPFPRPWITTRTPTSRLIDELEAALTAIAES